MKRERVAALILASLAVAAPPARAAERIPVIDATAIDHAVSPCENFYQFACGNWTRAHPIPADRGRWTRFDALTELNLEKLRAILEAAAEGSDVDTRKIGDFYASCMDESKIEADAAMPLEEEIQRIEAIKDVPFDEWEAKPRELINLDEVV